MARYRLFIGCSFREEMANVRNYIREQVETHGCFTPIFGDNPDVTQSPAQKVRALIKSCHAAMIVETADRDAAATPWIYSEIGMAYQERLPIFALVDTKVKDTGLTKYAVCYESFDALRFTESRNAIMRGLAELETAVEDMGADIKTPENVLRKNLSLMLPSMMLGIQQGELANQDVLATLRRELQQALEDASKPEFADSDSFAEKLVTAREAKRRIAEFVFKKFLSNLDGSEQAIVLDSGTVTFTICEKLVEETCRVPIITNNIAVGRHLSLLPRYPCWILPGRLECRYLASLGEETDTYLKEKLKQQKVKYGFIAATSFSFAHGIAGNDPRHASFKKVILEECPNVVLVFEGEKIIQDIGIPIYTETDEWECILQEKGTNMYIITHQPEHWEQLSTVKKSLYERTIDEIKKRLGEKRITALTPERP